MIVHTALCRDGRLMETPDADVGGLRADVRDPGDFAWIGLKDPSEAELMGVAEVFGLHPLAVEDAVVAHQRPKLDRYDDGLFLVLKTLSYADEEDAVDTGEVSVFFGPGYLVTVRHGNGSFLGTVRERLESQPELLARGPVAAAYAIADLVVDEYEEVLAGLTQDVDEVEASVFSDERTKDSARIYRLKRELAEARRAIIPLREPIRRLSAGDIGMVDDELQPYFRDILDHLTLAADETDNLEMLLTSAFEAHVAQISLQQNNDMRRISAGAALIVVPTLIAGIYGMNFRFMPELDWQLGYPFALGLMAASVGLLAYLFRRSGWL